MRTIASVASIGMVGIVGSQAEEDEPVQSQGHSRSFESASEFDERKMTFEYLKERRSQKRLEGRLACVRQASERTRAEVERILHEDAERFHELQAAVPENAGVGIEYVEDENGRLVKQRASGRGRKPATRRKLTPEDRARIDHTRDRRHTRRWFEKRLLEIHEGRVKLSRVEYHAFVTFGRMRG